MLEAVQRKGLKGVGIDVGHDVAEALKKNGIDLAFIALHGVYGEDGTIQATSMKLFVAFRIAVWL